MLPKRKSVQPLYSLEKTQQHKLQILQLTEQHFPLLQTTLPSPLQQITQKNRNSNFNNENLNNNNQNNNDTKQQQLPQNNDSQKQLTFAQQQEEINNYISQIVQKLDFPSSFDHAYELSNMTSLATKQLQLAQQKQQQIISTHSQPSPKKKQSISVSQESSKNVEKQQQQINNDNNINDNSPNKKIKNKINNKKQKKQSLVLKQQLSNNSDEINDLLTTRSVSNENYLASHLEQVKSNQKKSYDSLDTIDTAMPYNYSPQKSNFEYYQNNYFSSNNIEDIKANISLITKQSAQNPQLQQTFSQKPVLLKSSSVPPQKITNIKKNNLNQNINKINRNLSENNNQKQQEQQTVKYQPYVDLFSDNNLSTDDLEHKENKNFYANNNNTEFNNIDSLFNDSMFMNSYNNIEKQQKKSCFDIEELDFPENINDIDFFNNSQELM